MAYSSISDLKNYIPESQLREITDDNDTDDIDMEKLIDAIRRADDHIDSYMRGRFSLPLSTVPDMIRDLSTRLAAYYLFKRSLALIMPESIKEDYKDCVKILSDIQRGRVSPFEIVSNPAWVVTNNSLANTPMISSKITNNWNAYFI
jgi:phage gp36-like protein